MAEWTKGLRELFSDPTKRSKPLFIFGIVGTVALAIWPHRQIADPLIVFFLTLLVYDSGVSLKALDKSLKKNMREDAALLPCGRGSL